MYLCLLVQLRGSASTENFFLCFNGMILIFGELLEHGDTVMKIYFFKVTVAMVTQFNYLQW